MPNWNIQIGFGEECSMSWIWTNGGVHMAFKPMSVEEKMFIENLAQKVLLGEYPS